MQPNQTTNRSSLLPALVVVVIAAGGLAFAMLSPPGSRSQQEGDPQITSTNDAGEQPLIIEEPAPTPEGMAWIPGGSFIMGDDDGLNPEGQPLLDERPAHDVELDGFWMDKTEVTNAQFQKFVEATNYVTLAERELKREDFAGQVENINDIPAEKLKPCSVCFNPNFDRETLRQDFALWPYQVWKLEYGANWRHPDGPESTIENRMDHPVVHVGWDDAMAYSEWAGKSLPTEAQWEYASRGGKADRLYPWGDELQPEGKWLANIWQGEFPFENKVLDSFEKTSPVASFPANGYGLHDMAGNVWEWCADFYRPDYYANSPRRNPQGPSSSYDPQEPHLEKRVQRGGSFMCNANYCIGYRNSARMKGDLNSALFHNGFRCVVNAAQTERYQAAQEKLAGSAKP